MTAWLGRLGDRANPVAVKEIRQAVGSRLVAASLLTFLAVQFCAVVILTVGGELERPGELNLRAGRDAFSRVQAILVGTCTLLIPAMTGIRLASERSDVNVDLLFISSLSPRAVLVGKLQAALALTLLLFSAAAPFMALCYVLRGLDASSVLIVLMMDFFFVVIGTAYAMLLASVPANRAVRGFLAFNGVVALIYLTMGAVAASVSFTQFGVGVNLWSWEFAVSAALAAGLTAAVSGLFFVWSVAMISPPAANRAYGVRAYKLAVWFGSFVVAAGVSLYAAKLVARPTVPILIWCVVWTILWSMQILIGISEREAAGARVLRQVPHHPLRRWPAFLTYSGAAGGTLLGAMAGATTVTAVWLWHWLVMPTVGVAYDWRPLAGTCAAALGYVYCYGMTAVLVRRLARGTALKGDHTWVVAAILFGFGCALPFAAIYLYHWNSRFTMDVRQWFGLLMPNAFVTIEDIAFSRGNSHWTFSFLTVWGLAVTLLNAGWMLRQAAAFRHPGAEPAVSP